MSLMKLSKVKAISFNLISNKVIKEFADKVDLEKSLNLFFLGLREF